MFPAHGHSFRAAKLLLGALIFLQACGCALSSSGETCYSRQHRDTIVNVRKALDLQKTVMDVRKKEAERDCILACCSEELKPGIKCNMVVYKPSGQDGVENCHLFHCETEQDCPLMSASPGTNTYDIFK
ncbi:MANSC domain-containing protein 1, partial [Clarias magur]